MLPELVAVVEVANEGRDRREPGHARGSPAALARHQLVPGVCAAEEHRLHHAARADGVSKLLQGRWREIVARLKWVRINKIQVNLLGSGGLGLNFLEQGAKPPPQRFSGHD